MRQALIAMILAASLWSFFASLDSGCGMDPWGQCNPAPPTIDEGCVMDPWGCPKGS